MTANAPSAFSPPRATIGSKLQFDATLFELHELIQHALERLRPAEGVALRTVDAKLAELGCGLECLDHLTHGICADALGELNDRLDRRLRTSTGLNVADAGTVACGTPSGRTAGAARPSDGQGPACATPLAPAAVDRARAHHQCRAGCGAWCGSLRSASCC
jgi:hypothetical protein